MKQVWRAIRVLWAPVALWCLVALAVLEPLRFWLQGSERYDEQAMREWIEEARVFRETLPELCENHLTRTDEILTKDPFGHHGAGAALDSAGLHKVLVENYIKLVRPALNKREEIAEALKALANPPTKMFPGQMPLFPTIYRIEIQLDFTETLPAALRDRLDDLDKTIDDVGEEAAKNSMDATEYEYLTGVRDLLQPIEWDSD